MRHIVSLAAVAALWLTATQSPLALGQAPPADSTQPANPSPSSTGGTGPFLPGTNPWHLGESIWGEHDWEAAVNPPNQSLGPFAIADLGILKPHLRVQLMTPLSLAPSGETITLPVARLFFAFQREANQRHHRNYRQQPHRPPAQEHEVSPGKDRQRILEEQRKHAPE